jgi:hypothetical protein
VWPDSFKGKFSWQTWWFGARALCVSSGMISLRLCKLIMRQFRDIGVWGIAAYLCVGSPWRHIPDLYIYKCQEGKRIYHCGTIVKVNHPPAHKRKEFPSSSPKKVEKRDWQIKWFLRGCFYLMHGIISPLTHCGALRRRVYAVKKIIFAERVSFYHQCTPLCFDATERTPLILSL